MTALPAECLAQAAEPPPVLGRFAECRRLTDDRARLACYDDAAAAFDQAQTKGDIIVVDREQATQVRRQAFGLSLPSLSLLDRDGKGDPLDRINETVAKATQQANGRWLVEFESGAVWAQVDNEPVMRVRTGSKAEVRKGALGSFFINIDGQRGFRAQRRQ